MKGATLHRQSRTAVAMAAADTLNTATSELLARHDLEPVEIARQLLTDHPARSYLFSDTEGRLYEQIVGESCQYIVVRRITFRILTHNASCISIVERQNRHTS